MIQQLIIFLPSKWKATFFYGNTIWYEGQERYHHATREEGIDELFPPMDYRNVCPITYRAGSYEASYFYKGNHASSSCWFIRIYSTWRCPRRRWPCLSARCASRWRRPRWWSRSRGSISFFSFLFCGGKGRAYGIFLLDLPEKNNWQVCDVSWARLASD